MRRSRLSWSMQRRLIEHFVSGSTARTAASLVEVNKSTAAFYFHRLREIIALQSEDASLLFGEIEVDESYFGGHRKDTCGRGAGGKIPVFGLLKRGGKVYAKVIPDAKGKVVPDSIIYSDTFRSYDVLDVSNFKHLRINHSELFSDHKNHINGIENFWNQAKRHMRRFNGIPATHFYLYLKECEWRFNTPQPKQQQTTLIQWVTTHLK
jgi:transposase